MRVCCCSLAGTRACDNCKNGPSKTLFNSVTIFLGIAEKVPDKPTSWSITAFSGINEKTKDKKG